MELNEQNINNSIYFEKFHAFNRGIRKNVCSDYFFNSSEVLQNAKNFVLIRSGDGKPSKISKSLYLAMGYSDDELRSNPGNEILFLLDFNLNNNGSSYYFNSVLKCKGGINKKIIWRFIPNLLINEFVYIGWET